ncbi:hypothetical protein B0H63DRAFT_58246 [Podospora didyma]|uniref:Uncharacterized protein n=1 Tax=Podospora didyma TaxID=330526 RepID=A0AAE0U8L0_9PEZI|nr:hypothetical protein B0H63DRAFT_58246 [Podospora didyma]
MLAGWITQTMTSTPAAWHSHSSEDSARRMGRGARINIIQARFYSDPPLRSAPLSSFFFVYLFLLAVSVMTLFLAVCEQSSPGLTVLHQAPAVVVHMNIYTTRGVMSERKPFDVTHRMYRATRRPGGSSINGKNETSGCLLSISTFFIFLFTYFFLDTLFRPRKVYLPTYLHIQCIYDITAIHCILLYIYIFLVM